MAKRFTDTGKWDDDWFMELSPPMKCVWDYLCSHCDGAGFWKINVSLMAFKVKAEFTLADVLAAMGERVVPLPGGGRLWIAAYVRFQYKKLIPRNKAHRGIARMIFGGLAGVDLPSKALIFLDELAITMGYQFDPRSRVYRESIESEQTLNSASIEALRIKDKGIRIKDKGIRKRGVGKNTDSLLPPAFDFDALYQKYPNRVDRSAGLIRCAQVITTAEDYEALSRAIDRYAAHVRKNKTKFVLHFSTFVENRKEKPYFQPWRDWLEEDAGKVIAKPSANGQALYSDLKEDVSDIFPAEQEDLIRA